MKRRNRGIGEATEARIRAEVELEAARRETTRTRAQTPKYRDLGERLAKVRERNHIAESLQEIFRGGVA